MHAICVKRYKNLIYEYAYILTYLLIYAHHVTNGPATTAVQIELFIVRVLC